LNILGFTATGSVCLVCVGGQVQANSAGVALGLETGPVGANFSFQWGSTTLYSAGGQQ
jgi:hypothetical protein